MDPLDITQSDETDNVLPDTPHLEIMFDALEDTIAGTEGMALTPAQHYAHGVLQANSTRCGNESFFGSIASGIKSAYDYIIKMFKSIWGFFFNRDAAVEIKETKAVVQAEITKVEKAPAPTPEQKEKKAEKKPDEDTIVKAYDNVDNLNKKFETMMENVNKRPAGEAPLGKPGPNSKAVAISNKIGEACRAYEKSFKQELKRPPAGPLDKAPALVLLHSVMKQIEAGEKLVQALKDQSTQISSAIKGLEKAMNAGPLKEEDNNELRLLRVLLKMGSTVSQYLKRLLKGQQRLSKEVGAVFAA